MKDEDEVGLGSFDSFGSGFGSGYGDFGYSSYGGYDSGWQAAFGPAWNMPNSPKKIRTPTLGCIIDEDK